MNNRDNSFLQKLKNNAFYLSLGIGLLAILAVVAVYTAQQSDKQLAENDLDLNVASDYSSISTEGLREDVVEETNGAVASGNENRDDSTAQLIADEENEGESTSEEVVTETTTEITTEAAGTEEKGTDEVADATDSDSQESLPVTVNAGELDFNSEKTISWPVNGEVLLPYSMETTVYFETLDQYQCNPGMLIQAGIGTTVQNAYLGQVTKVTSDNTYGNLVTLYIGNDYSIVYGQLDTIYVKEGDFVKAGQSIGTVGKPTDSFKEEGSHLYFQMLHGEETVDPMMFIE